jgi:hypothetical protein
MRGKSGLAREYQDWVSGLRRKEGYQDCADVFQSWDGYIRIGKGISDWDRSCKGLGNGHQSIGKRDIRIGRLETVFGKGTPGFGR